MNIQRYITRTTALLVTLLMLNACSDEHTNENFADNSHTLLRVSLSHFNAEGQAQPVSGENRIERMDAYFFEDGVLTEYHPQLTAERMNLFINPLNVEDDERRCYSCKSRKFASKCE